MQRGRCPRAILRAVVAAVAFLAAADAAAQVVPVRLYPLDASALKKADATDAESLFEAGFARMERRARAFVAAEPVLLRRSCGPKLSTACLARLAGPGLVVTGSVVDSGGTLSFTLVGVDASGRVHGPVKAFVDAYISSAEPITRALLDLETRVDLSAPAAVAQAAPGARPAPPRSEAPHVAAAGRPSRSEPAHAPPVVAKAAPRPGAPSVPLPPPPPGTTLSPSRSAVAGADAAKPSLAPKPPPPSTRVVAALKAPGLDEAARSQSWMTPVGKWVAAAGLGLLAAGATTGWVGSRMSDSLDAKYRDRALSGADLASYDRVRQVQLTTNMLLVAGGVATTGGVLLWYLSPSVAPAPGGASVGVSGSF
jgi:hypothetical protein